MSPILGQIIRLTRTIHLHSVDGSIRPSAQFLAGKRPHFGLTGGFGLSWWYTSDTFLAFDAVTNLIIRNASEFRDCDPETISETIKETLHEVCVDKSIFDVDAVVFAQQKTLFECRSVNAEWFSTILLRTIEDNLRTRIGRRCTIYVVPRLQVASFNLCEVSVRLIEKNDGAAWSALIKSGYQFDGWTPQNPTIGLKVDSTFSPQGKFESLLVGEEYGTQKGAQASSVLKFRMLIAVLAAIASEQSGFTFHKAMARPFEFCVQFPHESCSDKRIFRSDCRPIIPFFVSDIHLGTDEIEALRTWYAKYMRCSQITKDRLEKSAHFINRGMNTDDIESYINYFVALDALFGERHSVETSILAGIVSLGLDAIYVEKARWLFDLRSELVHGGSRQFVEWPKYGRYVRHFRTRPLRDVQVLSQMVLTRAPEVLR